jgi:hypothetical protein
MGGMRTQIAPTMYRIGQQVQTGFHTFSYYGEYPLDEVVPVAVTGMGCILIHRGALQRVRDKYGEHWFDQVVTESGATVGEDFSLCLRMGTLGIPVHVHTGVPTTHHKEVWLGEDDYLAQLMADAVDPQALSQSIARAQGQAPAEKTWTVPRYAIVPTRNRPARLLALVYALSDQCDHIVVLDNASDPPVDAAKLKFAAGNATVTVLRDDEQPPNLSRFFNLMLDQCGQPAGEPFDVAVLNDDDVVPAGWYDACSTGLRGHGTALIAHTAHTEPALLTDIHNDPRNRMCPHAFVMRGEAGLRADESLRWWFGDTDLDLRARQAGGVLSVQGPTVINAHANQTTNGELAEQARRDHATFVAKWGDL